MQTSKPRIDDATARKLAVEAEVDPRSIKREYERPGSVRGMAGHRSRALLQAKGMLSESAAQQGR